VRLLWVAPRSLTQEAKRQAKAVAEMEQRKAEARERAEMEEAIAAEARRAQAVKRESRRRKQAEADRIHVAQLQVLSSSACAVCSQPHC
jgi:rRNA pseudouridine-1189 N-methylase Emg1 (Nep1/Mra1 family)